MCPARLVYTHWYTDTYTTKIKVLIPVANKLANTVNMYQLCNCNNIVIMYSKYT